MQVIELHAELDSDAFLFSRLNRRCRDLYRKFGDKEGLDPPSIFTHYYEQCIEARCDDDESFIAAVRERLMDEEDHSQFVRILGGQLRRPVTDELVIYAYTIRHTPDSVFKSLRDARQRIHELERAADSSSSSSNRSSSNSSTNKRQRVAADVEQVETCEVDMMVQDAPSVHQTAPRLVAEVNPQQQQHSRKVLGYYGRTLYRWQPCY